MIFLFVLAVATGAAAAVLALRRRFSARLAASLGMAVAMAFAGTSHLLMPTPFVQHLPTWVPMREELVFFTGLLEIALGIALLLRQPLRRWAGLALAGYLVMVFPSNIYVAVAGVDVDGQPGGAYPWLRLPLQLLFIAWALWSTRDAQPSESDAPRAGKQPRCGDPGIALGGASLVSSAGAVCGRRFAPSSVGASAEAQRL